MEKRTEAVGGNVNEATASTAIDGWVSPDVTAAQAGEKVEFGKDLDEADQN